MLACCLSWLRRFAAAESGPTAVEYALMLALLLGACIASISAMGGASKAFWQGNVDEIERALDSSASPTSP